MTNETKNVPELRFPEFDGEWEEKKIGELSQKTISGGTPRTSKLEFWNGDIPWIQSSDLSMNKLYIDSSNKSITEEAIDNSSAKIIPAKSIAIVTRVGVGKLAFVDFKYSTSQDFISLANLIFDTNFSIYSLYNKIKIISKNLQGTSIKGITKNELLNTELLMPIDILEQQKIGVFFSKLDQQIELEEKKLAKLEEQKKGYMQKIFYQELRFKNENGNNYPEWEEKKLGDLISEISIKTKTNNQYTLLSSTKNGLVSQEEYFRKQIGSKDNTGYKILKLNQMVISPQNLWLGNINFNEQFNIGIVSPSYRVFELNTTFYLPFAKNILRSARYIYEYSQASEQGASVVRRNLNIDLFNDIKINLPIIEEQEKIGNFFSEIDKIIEKQSQKIDGLKSRKKGFLQKMFV